MRKALELLKEKNVDNQALIASLQQIRTASRGAEPHGEDENHGRVIEGVFNGEKMIGDDGSEYHVPANYASKSKLVEGDLLKLTIAGDGSFIYKQIGPIDRRQLVGMLVKNESTGDWYAMTDGKRWRLLTAAVTYFHGQPGDEAVIQLPKSSQSIWAAVENIIKVKP
ncbi:MAG: hypothetical protein A2951_03085 [Candidatus Buchananbacteria bacterium RIFCSPLOWO2_01_FULL_56_15]|uniref:50S ribosomal protein L7/L12 n=1 Tax=Candidatus Buchananbacteria bacterium RIFCSPLOWO2_01_FULL_56_15 TaxID=1797547 RepID=A0A1G1YQQ6_9BACT|nr:MAG: hypothetical protein A2951_03085 [Candidatus Buchananbacteria bacterium RIFCSPLOWO2_01_FULL_56_15]